VRTQGGRAVLPSSLIIVGGVRKTVGDRLGQLEVVAFEFFKPNCLAWRFQLSAAPADLMVVRCEPHTDSLSDSRRIAAAAVGKHPYSRSAEHRRRALEQSRGVR
jgi:hypothetical protein